MKNRLAMVLLLAATPILAPSAFAHAHLKMSDPTAGANVKSPRQITLKFSEEIEPAFSGSLLVDGAGRQLTVSAAVNAAGIALVTPGLKPGTYKVEWHSVGHDTHRVTGSFTFTVIT